MWVTTSVGPEYPALDGDIEVDVAVIGAGLTGLTTARLLAGSGPSVAVIEAGRVCSGVTGYTTAKVTSLHRLVYRELIDRHGEERAAVYADANQAAITRIADLVADDGIDCDLEAAEAFTYTADAGHVGEVEAEVEAALRLGLPARFTTDTDLPFPVEAAIGFTGQAQFHPRKYCLGLADAVVAAGGRVHEHTRAVDVDESDGRCVVTTDRGTITAGRVVLATHLPFLDQGGFFARAHPYRSYAIAVTAAGPAPAGMYITVEQPGRSLRRTGDGGLIVGGEGHKTGQDDDTRERYRGPRGVERRGVPWIDRHPPLVGPGLRERRRHALCRPADARSRSHPRGHRIPEVGHDQRHRGGDDPGRHRARPGQSVGRGVRLDPPGSGRLDHLAGDREPQRGQAADR